MPKTETFDCGLVSFGSDGEPIEVRWTEQHPDSWFDDMVTWVASQPSPEVMVVGQFGRDLLRNGNTEE